MQLAMKLIFLFICCLGLYNEITLQFSTFYNFSVWQVESILKEF